MPEKLAPGSRLNVRPEIHVLVPFTVEDGKPTSPEYDTAAYRAEVDSWFTPLGLAWNWHAVTTENLADTVEYLAARAALGPVVAFNVCDGFDSDGYPGPALTDALFARRIPFTGSGADFYRTSSSKLLSKTLFRTHGVRTAPWLEIIDADKDLAAIGEVVGYPALLKLSDSAGGDGLDRNAVVQTEAEARARYAYLVGAGLAPLRIYAEGFLSGREVTVFVRQSPDGGGGLLALPAVEMVYDTRVPVTERMLFWGHRALGVDGMPREASGPPRLVYGIADKALQPILAHAAIEAFRATGGDGYGSVDLRFDAATGLVHALEVNANCSLSSDTAVGPALAAVGATFAELIEEFLIMALNRQ